MVETTVPRAVSARPARRPRWFLGWPMRPLVVIGPAAAIFVVALASTWAMTRWRYPQWVQTSAALHEQLLLTGPIAAAAACYCAAALCGPRSLLALPSSTRTGWRTVTRQCATPAVWFVAAYLLAFVPLMVDTARRATGGAPDLLAMAGGPVGLAALVVFGYALGTIAPSPIVAPGVAVVAFVLLQLRPVGQSSITAVLPVQGSVLRAGLVENPGFSLYRLLFLAVLGGALVLAAGAVLRLRRQPWRVRAGAAGILVLPIMLAVAPVLTDPMVVLFDAAPPRVCDTTSSVQICVHEAFRKDLPAVTAVASRVLAAAGGPSGLRSIVDTSLVGSDDIRTVDSVWINLSSVREVETSVPADIASAVTGEGACFVARGSSISGIDLQREDYSARLTQWVLSQAGFPATGSARASDAEGSIGAVAAPATPFGNVEPALVRGWLVEERPDLLRCSVPADRIR